MKLALKNKNFIKIFLVFAVVAFLWMGTVGLLFHFDVMKSDHTNMNGCLFNGQPKVCTMDFSEHITLWQSMLTTLPQEVGFFSLLLLATLLLLSLFDKKLVRELSRYKAIRWKLYIKQHPQITLFNFLREILSLGILNPKVYEAAIL